MDLAILILCGTTLGITVAGFLYIRKLLWQSTYSLSQNLNNHITNSRKETLEKVGIMRSEIILELKERFPQQWPEGKPPRPTIVDDAHSHMVEEADQPTE